MKFQYIILLISCFFTHHLMAQNIGVNSTGATPNESAILDVSAADKGFLIPRLALNSILDDTTITNPATSLLVWNTNASIYGGSGVGYYYNAGNATTANWVRLVNNIDLTTLAGWRLTGNAGTNSGANFIGTTDQRRLAFRTDNVVRMSIDSLHGRVGIGTIIPAARLHVADSSVVFSATGAIPATPGDPPISGAGRRMMWYPEVASFRVGVVSGTHWDGDSIGIASFAAGANTRAVGDVSAALGNETNARGLASTAFGNETLAWGNYSTAMGSNTTSIGQYSTAMGQSSIAMGDNSLAMGQLNQAISGGSIAIGFNNRVYGGSATAIGNNTQASGPRSTTIGLFTRAKAFGGTTLGMYNDTTDTPLTTPASTDRLFQIGKGTADNARSNALTVLKNGNIGLANKYVPLYPLSFENATGGKISFWENGTTHYGIGVQSSLLQFFTDGSGADIAFGYGSSAALSENMRIKGNGNVGIGIDPATGNKLQVNGKTATTNFQMTNGATANFILRSDAAGNASWVNPSTVFSSGSGGTLDQAYDYGGAGLGRTITADANAVLIQGTDGLQVTGTFNTSSTGFTIAGGTNPRMFFFPARGAFRTGRALGTQWNIDSIGFYSMAGGYESKALANSTFAYGFQTTARGANSFAAGRLSESNGDYSISLGIGTISNGDNSFSSGINTRANGISSVAMGTSTFANGSYSTSLGYYNKSKSYASTVIGMYNDTTDSPLITTAATDRLFQIGKGTADNARSNAMTVLANGNVGLANKYTPAYPLSFEEATGGKISFWQNGTSHYGIGVQSSLLQLFTDGSGADIAFGYGSSASFTENMRIKGNGNVGIGVNPAAGNKLQVNGKTQTTNFQMTNGAANGYILRSDATGNGTWTNPTSLYSGTLDQAYDFGGAGAGRIITADANAVLIQGTDGLQVTGTYGTESGSFALAGGANPRMLFVPSKAAFRAGRVTGTQWNIDSIGNYSFAGGLNSRATNIYTFAFGNASRASGINALAIGSSANAIGDYAISLGFQNNATGEFSYATGVSNIARGSVANAQGYFNKVKNFAGTAVGMFNDTSDVVVDPAAAAAGDRIFVVGNGSTDATRSNAMTVLKNGNVGLGVNYSPAYPLSFAASTGGKISLYQSGSNHYGMGVQGSLLQFFTDGSGSDIAFGYGSSTSFTERMRVKGNGDVGIGVNPTEKLHVAGKVRIVDGSQANNNFLSSDANGVATWKPVVIKSIEGYISPTGKNIPYNTTNYLYTGSYIMLPPGKYSVSVTMLMAPTAATRDATTGGSPVNSSFWLRSTFADISTLSGTSPNFIGTPSGDIVGGQLASAGMVGPSMFQTLIGTIVINNTSGSTKIYYYCAGDVAYYNTTQTLSVFGSTSWNENRIVAIPVE